jgi:hypothetical protein
MRTFLITINLDKLRENLSREDERPVTQAEVEQWLKDAGFTRVEDGWTVREADLGQLDPSEVITAEVIEEGEKQ